MNYNKFQPFTDKKNTLFVILLLVWHGFNKKVMKTHLLGWGFSWLRLVNILRGYESSVSNRSEFIKLPDASLDGTKVL